MHLRVLALAVPLFFSAAAPAQAPAAPTYDVATIKHTDFANEGRVSVSVDDTILTTIGTNPRKLLQIAFDVPQDLILDIPKWAESIRYDVNAKDSTTDPAILKKLSDADTRKMLQGLLAERFGLKYHMESREVTAYELVSVHPLPALKPVENAVGNFNVNNQHMRADGVTIEELAKRFGDELHRPVVDHTGLKGFYNVDLRWRRDDDAASAAAAADPDAPPILITAVQEQLGLKMHTGRYKVPVLVVDQLTPPTAN